MHSRQPIQPVDGVSLRMLGRHQFDNAAVAIAAWQRLCYDGWSLPLTFLRQSIAQTQLACRVEVVSNAPTMVIDTSHNVASIEALLGTLSDYFSPSKKNILFACSKDKDYETILDRLMRYADRLILTQFANNPRAVPIENLQRITQQMREQFPRVEIFAEPDSRKALRDTQHRATPSELICATGSFFLASELRPLFSEPFVVANNNE